MKSQVLHDRSRTARAGEIAGYSNEKGEPAQYSTALGAAWLNTLIENYSFLVIRTTAFVSHRLTTCRETDVVP
jgi:hypothetical protein